LSKESCLCLIQQKELKQSYAQFLGVQIPESCVILQVEARNNNIQELANFINDGSFADQLKEGGAKIMAIPNNGKVYIVFQAEFIDSIFKEVGSLVPFETSSPDNVKELKLQFLSDSEYSTFVDQAQ
jgi:hypothetical protein